MPGLRHKYDAILVDTSIFKQYKFKLETGLLSQLIQFKNSPVRLILPQVIYGEMDKYLREKLFEVINNLNKKILDAQDYLSHHVDNWSEISHLIIQDDYVENIVRKMMGNFIESTGAIQINESEYLKIEELLKYYFNNDAPFSKSGKKKNEFPDAITLLAVNNWAMKNRKHVIAISMDGDWKDFCKNSDHIDCETKLSAGFNLFHQTKNKYYNLIDKLSNALTAGKAEHFLRQVYTSLSEILSNIDFSENAYSSLDYKLEAIDVRLTNINLLRNDEDKVQLRIITSCTVIVLT